MRRFGILSKNQKVGLFFILALLGVVIAYVMPRNGERFNGWTLDEWLQRCASLRKGDLIRHQAQVREIERALDHFGTNAAVRCIDLTKKKDGSIRTFVRGLGSEAEAKIFRNPPAETLQARGYAGLYLLASKAEPAVPTLLTQLSSDRAFAAAISLFAISTNSARAAVAGLASTNPMRQQVMVALCKAEQDKKVQLDMATRIFIYKNVLLDGDPYLRVFAVVALSAMSGESKEVIPIVESALKDSDGDVREQATNALRSFKSKKWVNP